jgi:hypothetical protein
MRSQRPSLRISPHSSNGSKRSNPWSTPSRDGGIRKELAKRALVAAIAVIEWPLGTPPGGLCCLVRAEDAEARYDSIRLEGRREPSLPS